MHGVESTLLEWLYPCSRKQRWERRRSTEEWDKQGEPAPWPVAGNLKQLLYEEKSSEATDRNTEVATYFEEIKTVYGEWLIV